LIIREFYPKLTLFKYSVFILLMEIGFVASKGEKPMEKPNHLIDKSLSFAIRIVRCCQYLKREKREFVMSDQLVRSGTSIGANIREANSSYSKKEFIFKLQIGLKEARETDYWLEILSETDYLENKISESLRSNCNEIIALLVSSINTARSNLA
jgi:four helix bundle protein